MIADREYYDEEAETMSYKDLEDIQFRKLKAVIRYAYDNSRFYRKRWKEVGVTPDDINSMHDFQRRIPPYTKDDVRRSTAPGDPTAGLYSCKPEEISIYSMTSGTTGVNTVLGMGQAFADEIVEKLFMRHYWMTKLRPGMKVFQVLTGWHFLGIMTNLVLTKMGASCVTPWGTTMQKYIHNMMRTMLDNKPDYFIGIPWMIQALMEEATRIGVEPRKVFSSVRYMQLSGEPMTQGLRKKIMDETDVIDVFDAGGNTDGVWGSADCYVHRGWHVWMDVDLLELVEMDSLEPVDYGGKGRWISTLLLLGGPLVIRYLGDDLAQVERERCECGRTHYRVRIFDRLDNTFRMNGRLMTPYEVSLVVEEVCGYRLFTIVNPEAGGDKLKLLIGREGDRDPCAEMLDEIDRVAHKKLGIGIEARLVARERLPFAHRKLVRILRGPDGTLIKGDR